MNASQMALMERNLGLSYEQRLDQLQCASAFVDALRGERVRSAGRSLLPRGSFQPEEIVLALDQNEVQFVVVGDWAAVARGLDEPVMLLEIATEDSDDAREALAAVLVALDAEAIDGNADALSLATIFGGLEVAFVPSREFAELRASAEVVSVRGSLVAIAPR